MNEVVFNEIAMRPTTHSLQRKFTQNLEIERWLRWNSWAFVGLDRARCITLILSDCVCVYKIARADDHRMRWKVWTCTRAHTYAHRLISEWKHAYKWLTTASSPHMMHHIHMCCAYNIRLVCVYNLFNILHWHEANGTHTQIPIPSTESSTVCHLELAARNEASVCQQAEKHGMVRIRFALHSCFWLASSHSLYHLLWMTFLFVTSLHMARGTHPRTHKAWVRLSSQWIWVHANCGKSFVAIES